MNYLEIILKEHRNWNFNSFTIFMKLISAYIKGSFFSCARKRLHIDLCNSLLREIKPGPSAIRMVIRELNKSLKPTDIAQDKEFIALLNSFFSIYEAYIPELDPLLQHLLNIDTYQKQFMDISALIELKIKLLKNSEQKYSDQNLPLIIDTISSLKSHLAKMDQDQKENIIELIIKMITQYNFFFKWGYELEKFNNACEVLHQLILTSPKKEKYLKQLLCYFSLAKELNKIESMAEMRGGNYFAISHLLAHCYCDLTSIQQDKFLESFFDDEKPHEASIQVLINTLSPAKLYKLLLNNYRKMDYQNLEAMLAKLVSNADGQIADYKKFIFDLYHCDDIELSQRTYLAMSLLFPQLNKLEQKELLACHIDWLKNASARYPYFEHNNNYAETVACICNSLMNCIPHLSSKANRGLLPHLISFYKKYPQKVPDLQINAINLAFSHLSASHKKQMLINRFYNKCINPSSSFKEPDVLLNLSRRQNLSALQAAQSFNFLSSEQRCILQEEYIKIKTKHDKAAFVSIPTSTALIHIIRFLPTWEKKVAAFKAILKTFDCKDFCDVKQIESILLKKDNELLHNFIKTFKSLPALLSYEECLALKTHLIDALKIAIYSSKKERDPVNNIHQLKIQLYTTLLDSFSEANDANVAKNILNQVFDEQRLSDVVMKYVA